MGLSRWLYGWGLITLIAGVVAVHRNGSATLRVALVTLALLSASHGVANLVMPRQNKEWVIPAAIRQIGPELTHAPRLFATGPRNAISEFYAGRALTVKDSPEKAWTAMVAGDVLIAVASGRNAQAPGLPTPPRVQQVGARMRCDIVAKPQAN